MKAVKRICISLLLGVLFISTVSTSVFAVGNDKQLTRDALGKTASGIEGIKSMMDYKSDANLKDWDISKMPNSKLDEKGLEMAKKVYNTLITEYKLSPACAAGVVGNAIQESAMNIRYVGKYYGMFNTDSTEVAPDSAKKGGEVDSNSGSDVEWIKATLDYYFASDDKWNEHAVRLQRKNSNGDNYTFDEFKNFSDPELAAVAFCVVYERCFAYSAASHEYMKDGKSGDLVPWGAGLNGEFSWYQNLGKRRFFAATLFEMMGGKVGSETFESTDGSDSIADLVKLPSEGELRGMNDPDLFADYYASKVKIELADYDSLLAKDLSNGSSLAYEVRSWGEVLAYQNEALPIKTIRAVVAFAGIVLILYSTILYIAYWFDRVNNLFEVSMLSILTRGRLVISPEDNYSTFSPSNSKVKTIIHRDIIWISLVGIAIGVLILTGKIYFLIGFFIDFAKSIINGFTLNK